MAALTINFAVRASKPKVGKQFLQQIFLVHLEYVTSFKSMLLSLINFILAGWQVKAWRRFSLVNLKNCRQNWSCLDDLVDYAMVVFC